MSPAGKNDSVIRASYMPININFYKCIFKNILKCMHSFRIQTGYLLCCYWIKTTYHLPYPIHQRKPLLSFRFQFSTLPPWILNNMLRSQFLNLLAVEIESFLLSDGEGIQLTPLWVLLVIFTCVVFLLVPLYVEVMCLILLFSFWFCLLYILSLISSQNKMRWVAPLHSTLHASCSWLLPAGVLPLQCLLLHAQSILQLKLGLMFWS